MSEFGDIGPALDAMLAIALDDLYAACWPHEDEAEKEETDV